MTKFGPIETLDSHWLLMAWTWATGVDGCTHQQANAWVGWLLSTDALGVDRTPPKTQERHQAMIDRYLIFEAEHDAKRAPANYADHMGDHPEGVTT